jgi:predicted nucleotidyltransferase
MVTTAREFCATLARDLVDTEPTVVGVYLHGSAVLGDWYPGVSDIDVLVVTADDAAAATARLAAVLNDERDCPGVGLEVSCVEARHAGAPAAPWPFVLHVTTAPHDRKTVWGNTRAGDPDLILHYLVARGAAWAAQGPPPIGVFGVIPRDIALRQMADELQWAIEHASESYAVLNACRALRYRDEGVVCSKSDAGHWARVRNLSPSLVQRALDARQRGTHEVLRSDAAAFATGVATQLLTG